MGEEERRSSSLSNRDSNKRDSMNDGDLIAKFYFASPQIVWETLYGTRKIEINWSDIAAIQAVRGQAREPGILQIEVQLNPPTMHSVRKQISGFTGGETLKNRFHQLPFQPGELEKHYEKIMFPRCHYPFFPPHYKHALLNHLTGVGTPRPVTTINILTHLNISLRNQAAVGSLPRLTLRLVQRGVDATASSQAQGHLDLFPGGGGARVADNFSNECTCINNYQNCASREDVRISTGQNQHSYADGVDRQPDQHQADDQASPDVCLTLSVDISSHQAHDQVSPDVSLTISIHIATHQADRQASPDLSLTISIEIASHQADGQASPDLSLTISIEIASHQADGQASPDLSLTISIEMASHQADGQASPDLSLTISIDIASHQADRQASPDTSLTLGRDIARRACKRQRR